MTNPFSFRSSHVGAKALVEQWMREYIDVRTYNGLGYSPPIPEAILPNDAEVTLLMFGFT
jgi:hypothetical protein